ncbi:hypothetical protein [Bradyrhizobium sp. BR 1432]|uniref:hypothetical protein n=1 Tax=Bradyrhizobium sp. BR 1432 TaxID=3447966 RepID=UPI003EE745E8
MMFFGTANSGCAPALEPGMQFAQTSERELDRARGPSASSTELVGFTTSNKSPIIDDAPRADMFKREAQLGADKTIRLWNDLPEYVRNLR